MKKWTDEEFKGKYMELAELALAFDNLQFLAETMDGKVYVIKGNGETYKVAPWNIEEEFNNKDYQWEEKDYSLEEIRVLLENDYKLNTRVRNEIMYLSNFQRVTKALKYMKYEQANAEVDLQMHLQFLRK